MRNVTASHVPIREMLPDGTFKYDLVAKKDISLLSPFAETVPMIQELPFKRQASNAVDEPLRAIQVFLYGPVDTPSITTTYALSGRTVHAPIELCMALKVLERAYLAHIEDYEASDCPSPYSLSMVKVRRSASYNWLGFIWIPAHWIPAHSKFRRGKRVSPFEVRPFMYSQRKAD